MCEVLAIGTPSISTLNAGTGSRANGLLVFRTIILSILEYYGAEWSEIQYNETADMMHREFYWLQLAEIKHFVLNAKLGTYNVKRSGSRKSGTGYVTDEYDGKVYGKLAPSILMKWLSEYAGESLNARAGYEQNRKMNALPPEIENEQSKQKNGITISEASEETKIAYKSAVKDLMDKIAERSTIEAIEKKKRREAQEAKQKELMNDYAARHNISIDQVAEHVKEQLKNGKQ